MKRGPFVALCVRTHALSLVGRRWNDRIRGRVVANKHHNLIIKQTTMKLHDNITPQLQEWIEKQHVFFVATAPLSQDGHVNLSPKGHDAVRILDDHTVCYMDMTGSGNETAAHIHENARVTMMWCAFDGAPKILRLYGRGEVVVKDETSVRWNELISNYKEVLPGARQIIVNHVERVQSSCGYAVPFMDYKEERETLKKYINLKGDEWVKDYQKKNNLKSIDGIETPLADVYKNDVAEE